MDKRCPKCDRILSSDCFYIKPKLKDGFDCYCKECRIKLQRAYYKDNSEKVKKSVKEYAINHSDEKKTYNSLYYLNNKDKSREHSKKWKSKNRDYKSKRRKSDPLFKMSDNIRNRVYVAFKSKRWYKGRKTESLLGCDWKTAHDHLENKFTDGMSWENYGAWHIDHIIPICLAKNRDELIELCHYSNLQPLWAKDNLIKNNKIIDYAIHTTI